MSGLRLEAVSKVYSPAESAVDDVSFEVKEGELVVLLGPSGCGKTTLLRLIAGLDTPSAGSIYFDGRPADPLPARRNVGMVFQHYAVYPHLTVGENLGFGLRMRGVSRSETHRQVEHAARLLELQGLLDRFPAALSGGQKQRVAIGRAIVRKPAVLLLDEPFSSIDAPFRTLMRLQLKQIQRNLGTSTILVTHDQAEALSLGDRIVVLRDGRVQQIGTPSEVYDRPANTFVAGFIGSPPMNLVPDTGCLVGFRPENVRVLQTPSDGYPVIVEAVEHTGSDRFVYGRVGERILIARTRPEEAPEVGTACVFQPLENARLRFDLHSLNLVQVETGCGSRA